MTEPLSPAAQAILAAWCAAHGWEGEDIPPAVFHGLAASFRALADAVVMKESVPVLMRGPDLERQCQRQHTREQILSIATELENHD